MQSITRRLFCFKTEVALVLLAICFLLVVRKIFLDYRKERSYWEKEAAVLSEKEGLADKLEKVKEEFIKLREKLLEHDIFYFKQLTEQIASEIGARIEYFRPLSNVEKTDWIEFRVKLGMVCSHQQLVEFISALEEKEVIEVEELRERGEGKGEVFVDLVLVGLARKEKDESAG